MMVSSENLTGVPDAKINPRGRGKIMTKQVRILKLHTQYKQGRYERVCRKIPVLHLAGEWLNDTGFHPGKIIHVHVENNCLVINAVDHEHL